MQGIWKGNRIYVNSSVVSLTVCAVTEYFKLFMFGILTYDVFSVIYCVQNLNIYIIL